ncbi:MAG: MBL fold metallo-hydrolase [Acidimicrobiia bacterium]
MTSTHLTVLGARGSIPVSGPEFVRYGGNTSSFAVSVGGVAVAFVDAGTGLAAYRSFVNALAPSISLFLTHYHWDHIQGLSMLDEMWRGGCDVRIYGPDDPGEVLSAAIAPPLFPVAIGDAASVAFHSMPAEVTVGGVRFISFPLHHPQGSIGYRIDGPTRSIAIVTDHESGSPIDDAVADAIAGVDVLVHDAQYIPAESADHHGWGHSTCKDALDLAKRIGATDLVLTSHDPGRTDEGIDEILLDIQDEFPGTRAADQGLRIDL